MSTAERRVGPPPRKERKERREVSGTEVTGATFVSPEHEWCNEDTTFASPDRVLRDLAKPPEIRGSAEQAKDQAALEAAIKKESEVVGKVRDLGYVGVGDGISGKKNGGGALGSRFMSAEMSSAIVQNEDVRTVKGTQDALIAAAVVAHVRIMDYKEGRDDIKEMGAALVMGRTLENGDGTYDFAGIHLGDSRIYTVDGQTGEITQQTRDDLVVDLMVEKGLITPEQAVQIMEAKTDDELLGGKGYDALTAKKMMIGFRGRTAVANAVGGNEQFKPNRIHISGLKKGDKIILTSDALPKNFTNEQIREMVMKGADGRKLAEAASKGEIPDDATVQMVEIGAEAPESGQQELDVDVTVDNGFMVDVLQRNIEERANYIKGLKSLQKNRGALQDRERLIKDQERLQRIDELKLDYQQRSQALSELQQEAGVSKPDPAKIESAKESSAWHQRVYDAAVALKSGDQLAVARLEKTPDGKMAVGYVRNEAKTIAALDELIVSASQDMQQDRGTADKLGKLAFEHDRMAQISAELEKLEKERDDASRAETQRQIGEAHKLLEKAAKEAEQSQAAQQAQPPVRRATPPPRKKRNWTETGNE